MITTWPAPTLETGRLVLRAFHDGDRDVVLRMLTCPDTRAYLGGALSRRDAETRLRERPLGSMWGSFAVCEQPVGVVLGAVAFDRDGEDLEVTWQLLPEHRGLGYATEAVRAALAWAWAETGADQVIAVTQAANTPSTALALRVGMRQTRIRQELGAVQLEFRVDRPR